MGWRGLCGSRQGRAWSPRFATHLVTVDGARRRSLDTLASNGTYETPTGLIAPSWWGPLGRAAEDTAAEADEVARTEATGRVLSAVGVAHPVINPEQVVLYWVEEIV